MRVHVPVTRIDQNVNSIIDALDAGDYEGARRVAEALPWGLITIDEAKAALAKSTPFDDLDMG